MQRYPLHYLLPRGEHVWLAVAKKGNDARPDQEQTDRGN